MDDLHKLTDEQLLERRRKHEEYAASMDWHWSEERLAASSAYANIKAIDAVLAARRHN